MSWYLWWTYPIFSLVSSNTLTCEQGGVVVSSLRGSKMVGEATNLRREDLNLCFEKLMMVGGNNSGVVKMEGLPIIEWKDIPMELLLRIVSLVDDRTVVIASGVCSGWRDAICLGLTHLSLSWYMSLYLLSSFLFLIFVIILCLTYVSFMRNNVTEVIIMHNELHFSEIIVEIDLILPSVCVTGLLFPFQGTPFWRCNLDFNLLVWMLT